MENVLVSDVMTRELITVGPDVNLLECARKMIRKSIGCLLITGEKSKFLGFLTQRDILWALVKQKKSDLSKIKAIDLSPKKVITISSNTNLKEAMKKMNKMKFDRFPVVDKDKVVGIITAKDILNFHPEIYPELAEYVKIREEEEKLDRVKKSKESAVIIDGICEECGERDTLYRIHGMLICESCKSSI